MLLSFVAMAAAVAGGGNYEMAGTYPGDWVLFRGSQDCFVVRTLASQASIRISYEVGKDIVVVTMLDPRLKDVEKGSRRYLNLLFVDSKGAETNGGKLELRGRSVGGNVGGYLFGTSGPQILEFFATKSLFGLVDDAKSPVAAMRLDGSRRAMDELKQCSASVARSAE